MANVLKITIGSSTYDISPSPSGTLVTDSSKGSGNYYVSNDVAQASATSYTSVDAIAATDTNATIFNKLTTIAKNSRYLYNRLGTTDISGVGSTITAAISALNSGKAAASHTHSYAGSSSAGGAATSANKLNTDAGSATQPVYFSGGVPVATTYSLAKSVPSTAVFTDTTYSAGTGISLSGTTFSNSGVRSIATGSSNGTISVNTNGTAAEVAVKGLGSAAYTWTTAYVTLPSIGQLSNSFANNNNKYDDGEANYYMPLFKYENYYSSAVLWSRNIYGHYTIFNYAWQISTSGSFSRHATWYSCNVRPVIYLR